MEMENLALSLNSFLKGESSNIFKQRQSLVSSESAVPWRISPKPFFVSEGHWKTLQELGNHLVKFYAGMDKFIQASLNGQVNLVPGMVLSSGKPPELIKLGLKYGKRIPTIIRPDLIMTNEGLKSCELDAVPGGLGIMTMLQKAYKKIGFNTSPNFLLEKYSTLFDKSLVIVVSEECEEYYDELLYLAQEVKNYNSSADILVTREGELLLENIKGKMVYRQFELFDLVNMKNGLEILKKGSEGYCEVSAPPKIWLEEKAMFWAFQNPEFNRFLDSATKNFLENIFLKTWVVGADLQTPICLSTGEEIQGWWEMISYLKKPVGDKQIKDKNWVLKRSGFSPDAWGSKSVMLGSNTSTIKFANRLRMSLDELGSPMVLQRFVKPSIQKMCFYDFEIKKIKEEDVKTRILPFYLSGIFVGALACSTPSSTDIVHGASNAIFAPILPFGS